MPPTIVSSERSRRRAGYTLVEISITLSIVGILMAVSGSQYGAYLDRARTARAIAELRAIADTIDPGGDDDATYPASLADAGIATVDPWGRPYQYLLIRGNLPKGLAERGDGLPAVAAPPTGAGQGGASASGSGTSGAGTSSSTGGGGAGSGSSTGGGTGSQGGAGSSGGTGGSGNGGGNGGNGGASGGGQGAGGGHGQGGGGKPAIALARKDRFLVPINSDFDLYSSGPDGESKATLNAPVSRDDIIRGNDGAFYGIAEEF